MLLNQLHSQCTASSSRTTSAGELECLAINAGANLVCALGPVGLRDVYRCRTQVRIDG